MGVCVNMCLVLLAGSCLVSQDHTSSDAQILAGLFNGIMQPIERLANGIADTTFGVVRGSYNLISQTVTNVISSATSVTERVRRLLEEFRRRMGIGIPELGLPILDPLTIERLDIDFAHDTIALNGYLENVEIRHLSRFRLDYVEYDLNNRLFLNITFPLLYITGKYDIKGTFGDMFTIFGKGPFWLRLYELSLGTVSQLRNNIRKLPGIYVDDLKISVKLKRIENNFENLMNDTKLGAVINKAITQLTPEGIDTVWDEMEPAVSKIVKDIINGKLQNFELSNLVGRFFNFFKFNLNQRRISLKT
ncbi:uncharacterized protein [Atheta coriaria]|uniref:uncharacterized protein isoform X2 n=1 Tax=Dalotia coriaria TaxID=877792 RepID=UPI0031F3CA5B